MATCPRCQSSISNDADFCGYCGGRLDQKGDGAGAPSRIGARSSYKPTAEEGWEPPDDQSLEEITRAVADDLASGRSQQEVIADLVTYDGWPEQSAGEFVEQVERHMRGVSVTQFIEGAFRSGLTKEQIVTAMEESGYDRRNAASWVSSVSFQMEGQDKGEYREFPTPDFLIGLPCILIGAAISYGTYASAGPGETYVIWWGIIAYGGFRVLRGIGRAIGGGG